MSELCGVQLGNALEGKTIALCIRSPRHPGLHAGNGVMWLGPPPPLGNVHRVVVTETRLECWEHCIGSEPHIAEYRAS